MKEYKIKIKELTGKIYKECCNCDSHNELEIDGVAIIENVLKINKLIDESNKEKSGIEGLLVRNKIGIKKLLKQLQEKEPEYYI